MSALIVTLPGDGIGPEVTAEARRVLGAVAHRFGHGFEFREALIGGAALDATGAVLPDPTLELCRAADAVLLGAVGGPAWDDPQAPVRPEQGLLELRRELQLFANLRPVRTFSALAHASPLRPERITGVDLLFVRELTGGAYFGEKRREPAPDGGERAADDFAYTTAEIERVVRVAAELARRRRGRLTSVDKANVLETSRLWRAVTTRVVGDEFPDLTLEHLLVDACAMHLLHRAAEFDVIVTENLFGDILTDEASMIPGSIGLLASAALGSPAGGRGRGLYEPIHGSAPEIAGQGLANPVGSILSAALLLRYSLGLEAEARAVETAVEAVIGDGVVTADVAAPGAPSHGCAEVGAAVAAAIAASPWPAGAAFAPPAEPGSGESR